MKRMWHWLVSLILAAAIAAGAIGVDAAEKAAPLYRRAAEVKIPTVGQYPPHIHDIAISPDGRWLADGHIVAAGSDGAFRVWNFKTGQIERVVGALGDVGHIGKIDVNFDGKLVAAVIATVTMVDGRPITETPLLKIFDIATGDLVATLPINKSGVSTVNFTPDGEFVMLTGAVAKDRSYMRLYRLASQQIVAEFDPPRFIKRSSAFSEDGKYFAVGGEQNILIYERVEQ